jgi:2-dehydropantoate 2-reductase
VIYGAGAIGATIGARMHLAGRDVVLVARGRQLEALRSAGLTLQTPDGEQRLAIESAASPGELDIARDDVVLLAMKGQDTASALRELCGGVDPEVAVVCAQNGVENERLASRSFARVYGMFVWVAAEYLKPGIVRSFAVPPGLGVLDLGCVPNGTDELARTIASDLQAAGFASRVDAQIMRLKYGKLVSNLANVVEALLGPEAEDERLARRAEDEALACYAAAGIEYASDAEISERTAGHEELRPIKGRARRGGSTWQSLARGTGVETAYLNGEIVLLGRLHGVPTPVNEALTQHALRMARNRAKPGSATVEELLEHLD